MLKRNWNWRNYRLFCHIFVIGEISIGEGGGPPVLLPLATPMLQVRKTKKVLANFLRGFWRFPTKISTVQKIVLSSSRGQGNFRGLEASRPRPRTWPSRPRPRTSKCVLEDVLEAKDVLEDSTSDVFSNHYPYIFRYKMPCAKSSVELVWKYGRFPSISSLKSLIPFHSGIFHIPYHTEISLPFHSMPWFRGFHAAPRFFLRLLRQISSGPT